MEIKTTRDLKKIALEKPETVTFMLPNLTDLQNSEWSKKFNELIKECGCSSGRQYLLYTTPVYIVAIVVLSTFTTISKPVIIILFIGALVLTGLTGKIVGIKQRNRKIRNLLEQLHGSTGIKEE